MNIINGWKNKNKQSDKYQCKLRLGRVTVYDFFYDFGDKKVNYFENVSANKTITAYYSKAKLKIKEPVEIETLLSKIDAIDF